MRTKIVVLAVVAFVAFVGALPLAAQDCPTDTDIGNFNVTYESAVYDGESTEFTYCITGLDVPDFHALSHWDLSLDAECADENNIVSCSPEPCYYQEEDPTTGITGIKFDDLEVEKGETECFSFALEGDWTGLIDDVTIGLKAATEVFYGPICGPRCRDCVATLQVVDLDTSDPSMELFIGHNRPPTVIESILVTVTDESGRSIQRTIGPINLAFGAKRTFTKKLSAIARFDPGTYTITAEMDLMNGVQQRSTTFVIPE